MARKHLPAEADPDMFTREGSRGNDPSWTSRTEKEGDDVLVTFSKTVVGKPEEGGTWSYRVTAGGEVVFLSDG